MWGEEAVQFMKLQSPAAEIVFTESKYLYTSGMSHIIFSTSNTVDLEHKRSSINRGLHMKLTVIALSADSIILNHV